MRQYFKQSSNQINGPMKPLNFLGSKEKISESEANTLLDEFFDNHPNDNAQEVKEKAWDLINRGESVSFNNICITSKPIKK